MPPGRHPGRHAGPRQRTSRRHPARAARRHPPPAGAPGGHDAAAGRRPPRQRCMVTPPGRGVRRERRAGDVRDAVLRRAARRAVRRSPRRAPGRGVRPGGGVHSRPRPRPARAAPGRPPRPGRRLGAGARRRTHRARVDMAGPNVRVGRRAARHRGGGHDRRRRLVRRPRPAARARPERGVRASRTARRGARGVPPRPDGVGGRPPGGSARAGRRGLVAAPARSRPRASRRAARAELWGRGGGRRRAERLRVPGCPGRPGRRKDWSSSGTATRTGSTGGRSCTTARRTGSSGGPATPSCATRPSR